MFLFFQVKAATGEEVSAEDLGGADLHCKYEQKHFSLLGFVFWTVCMDQMQFTM